MSVKIYNGMRSTIADPFIFGLEARKIMEMSYYSRALIALDALRNKPDLDLKEYFQLRKPLERSRLDSNTVTEAIATLFKSSSITFSDWDIGYELILIPSGLEKSNPLVLIFSADKTYAKALVNAGLVESYGYWDNTDRPDELSEADWIERKQAWKYLIEDDYTPAECGLTISNPGAFSLDMAAYYSGRN